MTPATPKRGSILIVILGVLLLLALLATTFHTLQTTERRISQNYTDDVRAKLLAQSGIENAIMELKANPSAPYLKYWGNDLNENGKWDPGEEQDWNGNNVIDPEEEIIWNAPLEWARHPSLPIRGNGKVLENPQNPTNTLVPPVQFDVLHPNGTVRHVGVSGFASSGTYAKYGDIYAVKINDISGRIYVNDGVFQSTAPNGSYSTVSLNLARILNALGKQQEVNVPTALCKAHNIVEPLGNALIHSRPAGGYRSKYDMVRVLGKNFKKVEPYITPYAWVDKNVANPVPLSAQMKPHYPITYFRQSNGVAGMTPVVGGELFRRGRGMNSAWQYRFANEPLMWYQPGNTNEHHNAIYALDELNPGYVEIVWRAPVNVNAASGPVLAALLEDVQGFFIHERRRFVPYAPSVANIPYSGPGFGGSPVSFTVHQKYYTWEWSGMTYDAQGFGSDEYGHLYLTRPIKSKATGGTQVASDSPLFSDAIVEHITKARSRGTAKTTTDGVTVQINYATKPWAGEFKSWNQFYRFLDNLVAEGVVRDNRSIFWDYMYQGWTGAPQSGNWSPELQNTNKWFPNQVSGSLGTRHAAYALVDALKANFNPNLHLNETNPDANLYLRVDKTDLVVNSTEFTFTPMGFFEIESLGRVLKPSENGPVGGTGIAGNSTSALTSGANHIIAEKKIVVVVKLFDAYRESTQRHFYQGQVFPKGSSTDTNSNKALEIFPEVDQGITPTQVGPTTMYTYGDLYQVQPFYTTHFIDGYAGYPPGIKQISTGWGYEYDGYIALSTYGGLGVDKPKGTLWTTPAGKPHFMSGALGNYEGMHSHFSWDFKCHFHRSALTLGDSFRDELGSVTRSASTYIDQLPYIRPPKIERDYCFNDDPSEPLGPYCTAYNKKYRIARSFRLSPNTQGSSETVVVSPPPYLPPFAPSDLRIDGAYSERHSAVSYWIDEGVSWSSYGGVVAAWVKPSFMPEHTGKIRKIYGFSNWHKKNYNHRNPYSFDLYFFAAHDKPPYSTSATENTTFNYVGAPYSTCSDNPVESVGGSGVWAIRPMSLMTAENYSCFDGALADWNDEGPWAESEIYTNTPSLNHNLHPDGLDTGSTVTTDGSVPQAKTTGSPKMNYVEAHRWTHIMWSFFIARSGFRPTSQNWMDIYVNGKELSGTTKTYAGTVYSSDSRVPIHGIHAFADGDTGKWRTNTIRLGESSYHGFGWANQQFPYGFMRNSSSDATYDEFYAFRSAASGDSARAGQVAQIVTGASELYKQGRYYRPTTSFATGGSSTDALFESGPIYLKNLAGSKVLPPPSPVSPPAGSGQETSTVVSFTVPPTKTRLLGVNWTWYAEDYDNVTGVPVMYNHQEPYQIYNGKMTGKPLKQQDAAGKPLPIARVWLYVYSSSGTLKKKFPDAVQPDSPQGVSSGFTNDFYSKVYDPANSQQYYELDEGDYVRYRVGFVIQGLQPSTILLATPIFDDITVYFSQGDIEYLMWIPVNITN